MINLDSLKAAAFRGHAKLDPVAARREAIRDLPLRHLQFLRKSSFCSMHIRPSPLQRSIRLPEKWSTERTQNQNWLSMHNPYEQQIAFGSVIDVLEAINAQYAIWGGIAVMAFGEPRYPGKET